MIKSPPPPKAGLLSRLSGKDVLAAENNRLRAFLASVPGAWCGWATDGTIAYSDAFCALLNITAVTSLNDVQNALFASDAAVLEGLFHTMQENGAPFAATVHSTDRARTFKLSGSRGQSKTEDGAAPLRFDLLWLEDVTPQRQERDKLAQTAEQAEAERDRIRASLDKLPSLLWLRDKRGKLTWCNRSYADALETTAASVIADQRELTIKPRRSGGKVVPGQGHLIMAGQRRLVTIAEFGLADGTIIGRARDITREEELEAELQRYQVANNELMEQLGTAIAIFDSGQMLEFYNAAFAQLWKLEDNYLNGKPKLGDIMEKLREERRLPEQADFRKYKAGWLTMFTSLLQPHEEMLYLPDGRALRMLAVPHPMGGLMMTFEDVTSRLELESSYNTLIAVQKETLDNLAEGVAVFGGDGRLRLWNPSFAKLWALNPEDLDGNPHITRLAERMKARFSPDDWPRAQKAIVQQGIDRKAGDGRLNRADGTLVSWSTVPLPDGGVLMTHVDISDTARVENALREKNAALEAAERLKLDFLANVSYQLRTPLSAIMGFAEILNNEYFGAINARQREYTTGMREAGERLLSLIDDILDLSTIEAGYLQLNKETIGVAEIIDSIVDLTREWARKDQIEVRIECPPNVGAILADGRRVKQALLNLMSNAIAFSPKGSTITIGARRDGGLMRISVADRGSGISLEDQQRIFLPFERARGGPQGRGRGAGLGLTLVKNIVELHGGRIELDSAPDVGTMFTILVPIGTPATEEVRAAVLRIVK